MCCMYVLHLDYLHSQAWPARELTFSGEIETAGQVFSVFDPFAEELPRHKSGGCFPRVPWVLPWSGRLLFY